MDKKGAKGYWISTAKIINQDLFDEYVNKVGPWLKEVGGQVFAKDTEPQGKERTEDANLAVICEFPSMRAAASAFSDCCHLGVIVCVMHLQISTFKTEKWTRNRTSTSYEFL